MLQRVGNGWVALRCCGVVSGVGNCGGRFAFLFFPFIIFLPSFLPPLVCRFVGFCVLVCVQHLLSLLLVLLCFFPSSFTLFYSTSFILLVGSFPGHLDSPAQEMFSLSRHVNLSSLAKAEGT